MELFPPFSSRWKPLYVITGVAQLRLAQMLVESILINTRHIFQLAVSWRNKNPVCCNISRKWGTGPRFYRKKSSLEEKGGEQVLPASDNSFKVGTVSDLLRNSWPLYFITSCVLKQPFIEEIHSAHCQLLTYVPHLANKTTQEWHFVSNQQHHPKMAVSLLWT